MQRDCSQYESGKKEVQGEDVELLNLVLLSDSFISLQCIEFLQTNSIYSSHHTISITVPLSHLFSLFNTLLLISCSSLPLYCPRSEYSLFPFGFGLSLIVTLH